MQMIKAGLVAVCGSVLLTACAPDAWKNNQPFDVFLTRVQNACYYDPIGTYQVGDLLNANASDTASYFMDVTSRLYFGKMTPSTWTTMTTSQMQGNPTDRGVTCVLKEYEKEKKSWEK